MIVELRDIDSGLFDNAERIRELHKKQAVLMDELIEAIIHHKMVVPGNENNLMKFAWCEKSLPELRKIYRVVADPNGFPQDSGIYREANPDDKGQIIRSNGLEIDRANRTFSFVIPARFNARRIESRQSLSFSLARYLIVYLVKMLVCAPYSTIVWYKNDRLTKWERSGWVIPEELA